MAEQQFWEKKLLGLEGPSNREKTPEQRLQRIKYLSRVYEILKVQEKKTIRKKGLIILHWQLQAFCWNLLDCSWMTECSYHWAWFFSSTYKKILHKNGNANGQEKEKREVLKKREKKKKPTLSIDICSERQKIYKHIIPDSSYTWQFLKVLKWTPM